MVSFSAFCRLSYKFMEIKWICNKLSRNYLSKKRFGTIRWYSGIKKTAFRYKKRIGNPQPVCHHTPEFPIPYLIINCKSYTTPENPMNAMASRPAVIRAIGVPCIPFGTFTRLICSRSPAKSTSASPKPIAVENAYTTPVSKS